MSSKVSQATLDKLAELERMLERAQALLAELVRTIRL